MKDLNIPIFWALAYFTDGLFNLKIKILKSDVPRNNFLIHRLVVLFLLKETSLGMFDFASIYGLCFVGVFFRIVHTDEPK